MQGQSVFLYLDKSICTDFHIMSMSEEKVISFVDTVNSPVLTHFCADINHRPVPTPDLELLTSWSEGISNVSGQLEGIRGLKSRERDLVSWKRKLKVKTR